MVFRTQVKLWKWELIKWLVSFVPCYRMGILMETTDVNLGTSSYRGHSQPELFGAMGSPSDLFAETVHTIAINTMETEFGSIVEPIPITLKTYKQLQAHGHSSLGINGYSYPQHIMTALAPMPHVPYVQEVQRPSTSSHTPSPVKEETKDDQKITRPPKKKWIKEYLGESLRLTQSSVSCKIFIDISGKGDSYFCRYCRWQIMDIFVCLVHKPSRIESHESRYKCSIVEPCVWPRRVFAQQHPSTRSQSQF